MLPPPVPSRSPAPERRSVDSDDAIRATDDDAAASRLSAVALGYLTDPYVSLLYKAPRMAGAARKAPLINVGTHHRTAALDSVVDSFLSAAASQSPQAGSSSGSTGIQVISLGAGSDTRFWRLAERKNPSLRYVEVDFPHLTAVKAQRIARNKVLSGALSHSKGNPAPPIPPPATSAAMPPPPLPAKAYTVSQGGAALTSSNYALLPLDLREGISGLQDRLLPLLDSSKPTLLLAECVFCYMEPEDSRAVIEWFGDTFKQSAAVIYEMCGLDDAFGRVMHRNLAARNLSLPGAVFATPQAQADRFLDERLGSGVFQNAGAKSLWDVRKGVVGEEELARISKLEFLDEIEELRLVLSHYCVAWASKGGLEGVGL